MTLDITDPKYNVTVSLDDGVNCAITRGGWAQAGPNPLPGGLWGDVDETVLVSLLGQDDTIYGLLSFIARRAEEVQSPLHPDYLNPGVKPFVYAQTPDEGNGRWALVKSLSVEKLDPSHYRANGRTTLRIKFTREGVWRGLEPGSTPLTLRTYGIHTYTNGVQFANATVGTTGLLGDADPMTIMKVRPFPAATHSRHVDVAIFQESWYSSGTESDFTPYFWAKDITIGSPTIVNISTLGAPFAGMHILPGNEAANLGLANLIGWSIPASYHGFFSVYAVQLAEVGGTMYFQHGVTSNYEVGGDVAMTVGSPPAWGIAYLGTFKIPSVGTRIYGTGLANYTGLMEINVPSGKAIFGGLIFVPEPSKLPQRVKAYASGGVYNNPITVANGELEEVYWTNTSDIPQIMGAREAPIGPYQAPRPGAGVTNRLWFIPVPLATGGDGWLPDPQVDWTIGAKYIPRWQHINQEGL